MNTTKNQFSIGLDGFYCVFENLAKMPVAVIRKSEGASLIRGR
ncbi:MAG: hypothetical protein PHF29_06140 [Candidatus Riflebacteria bacterium]|nr:hypothetical protein [Candidatus Riflebacteria bacterium]